MITSTDPALCTNAPTTGFRIPDMARRIATTFSVMENVRFNFIVLIILRESASR